MDRGRRLGKTYGEKSVLLAILADLLISNGGRIYGGRIYGDGKGSGSAFVVGWNDTLQLRHRSNPTPVTLSFLIDSGRR